MNFKILSKLRQLLKSIDVFGSPLQLHIQSQDKAYQSELGGLSTICIYTLSIYYLIFLLIEWRSNGLKPQVNFQTITLDYDELMLPFNIFKLTMVDDEFSTNLKKLNQTKYYWNQSVSVWKDWNTNIKSVSNPDTFSCDRYLYNYNIFAPLCQNIKDSNQMFIRQNRNNSETTYIDYKLFTCEKKNDGCTDYDTLTKYSKPYWVMYVKKQDINVISGEIVDYESEYFFDLSPNTSTFINLKIVKGTVIIDSGFLWPVKTQTEIVKDIIVTSSISKDENTLVYVEVSLEKNSQMIYLTHPKITFILAQAGSILQVLLILGLVVNLLNSRHMEAYIQEQLLKLYFPSFQNYIFKTSFIRGRIIDVVHKDPERDLRTDVKKQLIDLRHKILDIIQPKLSLLNMIHDINKLQIAVQKIYPKGFKFQSLNYILSLELIENDIILQNPSNTYLNEEDFQQYFQSQPNFLYYQQLQQIKADDSDDINQINIPNLSKVRII